jgi:hypothetical protein
MESEQVIDTKEQTANLRDMSDSDLLDHWKKLIDALSDVNAKLELTASEMYRRDAAQRRRRS